MGPGSALPLFIYPVAMWLLSAIYQLLHSAWASYCTVPDINSNSTCARALYDFRSRAYGSRALAGVYKSYNALAPML